MNLDGTIVQSYQVSEIITRLCVAEGQIYFLCDISDEVGDINKSLFYRYDKDTQRSELLGSSDVYRRISKLEAANNRLYFIGIHPDYIDIEYSLASVEDRFTYSGERIACLDPATGVIDELPLDLPIAFAKAPDNNLLIYAYDEQKGYYFTVYNTGSKSFSEKIYHNLGDIMTFDVYNQDYDFMFLNLQKSGSRFTLTSASLSPDKGTKELIQHFPLSAMFNIVCRGDYTYCLDSENKNIIRIRNSSYLKSNKQIVMYSSITFWHAPFGCGYNIKQESLSDEELALALLSQDPGFDICGISSWQDISANIRNKGSFYPLNDIKGVKEYLDQCFPYVKEAATNADGDIWMLPIYVDIPCLLYNNSFCQSKGIEISNSMTMNQLLDTINKVNNDDSLKAFYNFNNLAFTKNIFYQYLRSHSSFNTDLFRSLALSGKSIFNYAKNITNGGPNVYLNLSSNNNDFMYLFVNDHDYPLMLSSNTVINAARIPDITDDDASSARNAGTCYFLTVNPASKNLMETLQYISSLSKYLLSNNGYLMLKDRTLYSETAVMDDLYEIYENGCIEFTYPNELFIDIYEKYLTDEMDLESFILEADRRLDTFLNE